MSATLADSTGPRPLLRSEIKALRPTADLRKPEIDPAWLALGSAMDRARLACLLSIKEFADVVKRDEAQCRRWFKGMERPQVDAVIGSPHPELPDAFLIALARGRGEHVEVTTQITVRQRVA